MWQLNSVTNNYTAEVSATYVVEAGETMLVGAIPLRVGARTAAINIVYLGTVFFADIANRPLGPSHETWGVVISFNSLMWVFRYEGNGLLNVVINADGTLSFSSPSGGTISPLPPT